MGGAQAAWDALRRSSKQLRVSITWLVAAGLVIWLAAYSQRPGISWTGLAMLMIGIAYYVHAWVRYALFICPRCGRRFVLSMLGMNPFARACRHCGLAKWTAV